jgi:nucleotide-binding universal stress UspA family protein
LDKTEADKNNNIILVPTDFSDVCGDAVRYAAQIAQFLNNKLVILHIIDKKSKEKLRKKNAGTDYIEEQLNQYKSLHEHAFGIAVETAMKEGNIFITINKIAADLNAKMMVIGTHGKKGLQYFTGSYILKVTDKSPVPVVILQKNMIHRMYKNILIPITHDLHSDKKIAWAKHFSRMFNANIHLFQQFNKDKIQNDKLSGCIEKITRNFLKDEIPYHVIKSEKETNFSSQVVAYAVASRCDIIMIIDVNHNVSSAAWYENLLFNRNKIPVMTINLARIKKPL